MQSLRNEELVLEMSAIKKQSKTKSWIDASPEGTVTPGKCTAYVTIIHQATKEVLRSFRGRWKLFPSVINGITFSLTGSYAINGTDDNG